VSHYKPYPSYKDSGVEWIGEVPEHWDIRSVKHLYDARLGKMVQPQPKSDEDVLVPYHRAQTVQWESIRYDQVESMWANPAEIEAYSLNEGDLLICEGGDVCRSAIFNRNEHETVIFQNSVHRVRPLNGNHSEWLLRLMQIVRSTGWIDVLCNKNTIVHFTSDKLASLECPHPPQDEQAQILTALRKETARIDALIAKKTRFIELLKEKRSALITHAVTKGLDPNVEMKDSGVEWLGEVPENWGVAQLRYYTTFITSGSRGWAEHYSESGAIFVRIGNLTRDSLAVDLSDIQYVEPTKGAEGERTKIKAGDLLFSITAYLGSIAVASNDIEGAFVSQHIALVRLASNIFVPKFAGYYALSKAGQSQLKEQGYGGTKIQLSLDDVKALWFPILPKNEQSTIATFLDRETARIDSLVEKTRKSKDLLKERRSALISAAVTGKIDVRDAL
jgi:type I restriction enzyme S subunit